MRFFEVVFDPKTVKWLWNLFALPNKLVYIRRKSLNVKICFWKWFSGYSDHTKNGPFSIQNSFRFYKYDWFSHDWAKRDESWPIDKPLFKNLNLKPILGRKWRSWRARFRSKTKVKWYFWKTLGIPGQIIWNQDEISKELEWISFGILFWIENGPLPGPVFDPNPVKWSFFENCSNSSQILCNFTPKFRNNWKKFHLKTYFGSKTGPCQGPFSIQNRENKAFW